MANNITIKDGSAVPKVMKTTDNAGVHTPHHNVDNLPTNYSTEATVAAILAKILSAPATEAKQDTGNTSLASILAKIIAAPATEAKQDSLFALLASIVKDEDTPHVSGQKGIMMLGLREDSDVSTADDGDNTTFKLDEEGRLKISSKPASYADVTGSITAVQATVGTPVAGGTVIADVSRASNAMMYCTGTFSTVNVTFEGCLELTGENWFTVQAVRTSANTIETTSGNLSAAPAYAWELSVNALARVRVRCTARTSGTQDWRFKLGTYATEPIPAAQVSATQPVSFTQAALPAGTALMGDVGMQVRANATGAASKSHLVSAASTNATIVKASAGRLYGWRVTNTNAAFRYVKLHNIATTPTAGTGVVETIAVPPNQTVNGFISYGSGFATGIGMTTVTGSADADNVAVGAGDLIIDLYFA